MKHDAKMHDERMPPAGDRGDRDPPGRSGVRDILRLRRALPRSGGPIAAGRDPKAGREREGGLMDRIHVIETRVERCIDCPSARSPINRPGDEWRCKQVAQLDPAGNIIGDRPIPVNQAWCGFPEWCPLKTITPSAWAKRTADLSIQRRKYGRVCDENRESSSERLMAGV